VTAQPVRGLHSRANATPVAVGALIALVAVVCSIGATAVAQRAAVTRRATTVPLLVGYPGFYHAQPLRVAGHLVINGDTAQLFTNEKSIILLLPSSVASNAAEHTKAEAVEVTGTFFDVGRTEAGDGRLSAYDLRALSQRVLGKNWPSFGELPILVVDAVTTPDEGAASVRAIALSPDRFADATVTLIGRFRGRNLFGDLPAAPGKSQWDFVIQSADAALWVTGQRPRGKDFDLRLDSRVDTGRWLEVSGTVRTDGVRAWVESTSVRLSTAPEERPAEVVEVPAAPPPRVIFSAPVEGEVDVELTTSIRIQFSRDMNPATFKGRVTLSYLEPTGGATMESLVNDQTYDEARRMLEIRLKARPQALRTLRLTLGAGITARDGAEIAPWMLTFTLGG
jgi:hypothetical protein